MAACILPVVRAASSLPDAASLVDKLSSSAYRVYASLSRSATTVTSASKPLIAKIDSMGLVGAHCGRWPTWRCWYIGMAACRLKSADLRPDEAGKTARSGQSEKADDYFRRRRAYAFRLGQAGARATTEA